MRFTRHARQRLADRGISEQEVEAICQNPHTTYPDPDGKPCRVGDVGGRTLRVVLAPDDEMLVITVVIQG